MSNQLVELARDIMRFPKYMRRSFPILYPKVVECSVCSWQGRQLADNLWHKQCECPKCRSEVRHRLLMTALEHHVDLSFDKLVEQKRVLHFAPEKWIERKIRGLSSKYVTADFINPRRDLQLDISDMKQVSDGEFDLLIACDVLEHVHDDHQAMREIRRVLSPGGYAILSVPQKDHLATTIEDRNVVDPKERERLYGQWDHLRIYGDDVSDDLREAGLEVTEISVDDFSSEVVDKHVLFPPVLSQHPLATNYRKIFFARAPLVTKKCKSRLIKRNSRRSSSL